MSGGMQDGRMRSLETRSAIVETLLDYVEGRVGKAETRNDSIGERLTRLEEKISHLPTKEQVVKIALGTLAMLTAIIVFQAKIQALIGLGAGH